MDTSIQSTQSVQSSVQEATRKPQKGVLGQSDFLKLLTTQLSNQDPFSPQDNGQFMSQMAQFGTVDGIQRLQDSFSSLSGSMYSNQALQASSLVGRTVFVPSKDGVLNDQGHMRGVAYLNDDASDLNISIKNSAGTVIKHLNLGAKNSGTVEFEWDGTTDAGTRAPAGTYEMISEANIHGKNFATPTLAAANVNSVTIGEGGNNLVLNIDRLGSIPFDQVWKIA